MRFNCIISRYRAKNRKNINRSKEHRIECQSPNEKVFPQPEEYYSIPNNNTVSPVPIQAVSIPIPRMGYDISFNPNYPPSHQQFHQPPMYTQASPYAGQEILPPAPHNVVLTNGGPVYSMAQPEFQNVTAHPTQNVDNNRRSGWDHMVSLF